MAARLGELLISRGVCTAEDVAQALSARGPGERIGEALVRLGCATTKDVARALAEQTGLRLADLPAMKPGDPVLQLVPSRFVFKAKNRLLPFTRPKIDVVTKYGA